MSASVSLEQLRNYLAQIEGQLESAKALVYRLDGTQSALKQIIAEAEHNEQPETDPALPKA
jgi:hypothetical protein